MATVLGIVDSGYTCLQCIFLPPPGWAPHYRYYCLLLLLLPAVASSSDQMEGSEPAAIACPGGSRAPGAHTHDVLVAAGDLAGRWQEVRLPNSIFCTMCTMRTTRTMKEPYRYGSLSQSVDLTLLSMEGYYRTLIQPGGLLPQRYGLGQSITLGRFIDTNLYFTAPVIGNY